MAYEQHTWVNGETITAGKLNNIEEGIVEASQSGGGSGIPFVTINKDMASGDHYLNFAVCKYVPDDDYYQAIYLLEQSDVLVEVNIGGYTETVNFFSPLPIPPEGLYLLVWGYSTWTYTYEGDIDPEIVTVSFGSTADAHIVTGNFTMSISD